MRQSQLPTLLMISLVLLFSSCQPFPGEVQPPAQDQKTTEPSPSTPLSSQPFLPTELPAESNPLPPDPLDVVFFSEDDIELKGKFYPAAVTGRPVLVFMHWYPGDQLEWVEIAYWLQNRGGSGVQRGVPWLDPSWFPTLPIDTSYNILTFTFRNCENGCGQLSPQGWLLDARASLEAARSLEGVDPDQIVAIGASIGGDAAASSCAAAVALDPNACLGALSLSPGSYLGESYPDLVVQLGESTPPRPAWCFYDQADPDREVCLKAEGALYRKEGWQGGNLHGMHLITPTLDPLPLSLIVEFIEMVTEN